LPITAARNIVAKSCGTPAYIDDDAIPCKRRLDGIVNVFAEYGTSRSHHRTAFFVGNLLSSQYR